MTNIENIENKLVVQANVLIEASYKLKPSQQKFLRVMASMINLGDEDFKMYEFKVSELMDLYEIKDQSKYSEIPKQTKELMGNVLTFRDEKSEVLVPFLSFYKHEKGEGLIKVQFHPFLKPFYLSLSKENPYTKYQLKNIVRLKSSYSIRFYELLKQYENIKLRTLTLNEIREIFKIEQTEYTRYNDFKRYVILQAQKELKEKTDISFDFEEIKTGRKVTSLKFYIKSNKKVAALKEKQSKNEIAIDQETPLDLIQNDIKDIMNITNNEFTEKAMMLFRDICNGDIDKIKKIYDYMNTKNINENRTGYMIKVLKDWEEPKQSSNINGFNNFAPREYDYDSLEKKLLGWDRD